MRRGLVWLLAMLVFGCTGGPPPSGGSATPVTISCQPFGYTPAPVLFSFPPGAATAAGARETAAALVRACQSAPLVLTNLTSTSTETTGSLNGPNAGQAVWRVEVEAIVNDASFGEGFHAYFLIEVNQETGVPTVVGLG